MEWNFYREARNEYLRIRNTQRTVSVANTNSASFQLHLLYSVDAKGYGPLYVMYWYSEEVISIL